ncbi:RING-H2 finger protein ATL56 [Sesamum alatum]|uniref:RING-type E3 ubiquitin transferase n=1 Tax=Sesamum alatum TaxID=300844 RepID=A0AAE1YKA9_9LAMI|nr:RING-H2 finger protein ATL56 [Sesamum alatum]
MPAFTAENHRHAPPPPYLSRSQRKLLLFFLKCVIMVVVISLFLFFLGFAAIVLLHFLFMSNTFHRRCTRLFHPTPAADDDASVSTRAAEGSLHIQALLPDVTYSAAAFPGKSDCAICLDSFQEGDGCRNIPVCNHLFHAKCIDRWIRKKPTCPVCRTRVDLDPTRSPGSRTGGDDQWKRLWAANFEEGTSY